MTIPWKRYLFRAYLDVAHGGKWYLKLHSTTKWQRNTSSIALSCITNRTQESFLVTSSALRATMWYIASGQRSR